MNCTNISEFICKYIGQGLFAKKEFHAGDFLLEYRGERLQEHEGEKRRSKYIYFFRHNSKICW